MTMYAIQVGTETVKVSQDYKGDDEYRWVGVVESPTFYLDSNVQGIVDEAHAKRIIENWLVAAGAAISHIHAHKVK